MMQIKIQNNSMREPMILRRMRNSDMHIVQETKPRRLTLGTMMTYCPHISTCLTPQTHYPYLAA